MSAASSNVMERPIPKMYSAIKDFIQVIDDSGHDLNEMLFNTPVEAYV